MALMEKDIPGHKPVESTQKEIVSENQTPTTPTHIFIIIPLSRALTVLDDLKISITDDKELAARCEVASACLEVIISKLSEYLLSK